MSEVYVGNLDPDTPTRFIERELQVYGEILSVKTPLSSSSSSSLRRYAFVEFKHSRDAQFAIHSWNSKFNWRLELSRNSNAVTNTVNAGSSCYSCGGYGHFARNCPHVSKDIKSKGVKQSQGGRKSKNQVAPTLEWQPVPPPWVELPEDITAKILHKLGTVELLVSARKVCTSWRKICRDPAMWRVIDMWKLGVVSHESPPGYCEMLCRLAVDLSQGQVTEINIQDFGSEDLLKYILERCGHLRCLRIAFCYDISFKTLSVAKGFPLLEELHLQSTLVENHGIEAIGKSCPMLKKLSLNAYARPNGLIPNNREALAVATFLPELRHLQLFACGMTNDALEAILNGCSKLESLDLRQCSNLNLKGQLGKRCTQQIKNLRRPNDSTDDYEWNGKVPYWMNFMGQYLSGMDACTECGYGDLDYGDFDYDDYCDPFQFDGEGFMF